MQQIQSMQVAAANAAGLTQEQARMLVPDKKALFELILRNQYIMPNFKDGLVTQAWMHGIMWKTHWCLLSEEAGVPKVCAKPPSRKLLA